eukprot:9481683-Pyramimonas_sp.AAC.1
MAPRAFTPGTPRPAAQRCIRAVGRPGHEWATALQTEAAQLGARVRAAKLTGPFPRVVAACVHAPRRAVADEVAEHLLHECCLMFERSAWWHSFPEKRSVAGW